MTMRAAVPLNLLPEMIQAMAWQAFAPWRSWTRGNWFYRRLLRGPLADHIVFHPHDSRPWRLEDADALLRRRFRFAGEMVEVPEGLSVFDQAPPSRAWAEGLHGFVWLGALSLAGGEAARMLATDLISQWLQRNARYSEPAWSAHVLGRRLIMLFCHGKLVIANSDMMWRSKLFVSLREQSRMLERIAAEAPEGLTRLEAAVALSLSGICMDDCPPRLISGLERLEVEIERQILPDGGHADRSPEDLLHAYHLLTLVMDAVVATGLEPPHALRNARDRIAPMLRFFRHGDGALALFQGGREGHARMLASLLARDDVRGQPFGHARHSGYQRLSAGRTVLQLDCGKLPEGALATRAHAGFLAFEMSSGAHRLVVNCGSAGKDQPGWDQALRATAAHSTLTLGDRSAAQILPAGFAQEFLGPRMIGGPRQPLTRRSETAQGWTVEASHDAYVSDLGIRHERKITLAPQGQTVTGADRLVPVTTRKKALDFALRFHIHPDVRLSRLEGGGVLLKLPNGEGWRFRAGGGDVQIEESVYLGGDTVRRTEQLVVMGQVRDAPIETAWVLEQIVV
jgi:uncharacterized heparinase superfamily protein